MGFGAPHQCSLGTAACGLLVMLTRAILMTSSHSEGHFKWVQVCSLEPARSIVSEAGTLSEMSSARMLRRMLEAQEDCKWLPSPSISANDAYSNPAKYYTKSSTPMVCKANHNTDDPRVCTIPPSLQWHGIAGDAEDTPVWEMGSRNKTDINSPWGKKNFNPLARDRCAFIDSSSVDTFSPQSNELHGEPAAMPFDLYAP